MSVDSWETLGSEVSLATTGLNSLANNSSVTGSAYDNSAGKRWAVFELVVTFASSPSGSPVVALYAVPSLDGGSTYSTTTGSPGVLIGYFEVDNTGSAQRIVTLPRAIPPGFWKPMLKNLSGQAFASSGNTLKMRTTAVQNS